MQESCTRLKTQNQGEPLALCTALCLAGLMYLYTPVGQGSVVILLCLDLAANHADDTLK